jgi:hypothetical protein
VNALLLCALAATSLTACDVGRLQFKNDHRLTFVSPESRAKVSTPFTLSWSMKDFDATGLDGSTSKDRGVFAVFVDRAPMPVGKDIKWIGHSDTSCKRDPRCPDQEYLASKGVFITQESSITIDNLPPANTGRGDEEHFVNVVLLNGKGQRIGETGWYREFRSKRRSS